METGTSAQDLQRQLAQPLLVAPVDVGVEQADGHALHVTALENRELPPGVVLVELGHHAAVGEDPLGDAPAQVAWDQRSGAVAERPTPARVGLRVERSPQPALDQDVPEALGGQERHLGQAAGDDRVDAGRAGVVEHRAALHPEPAASLHDRPRWIRRLTRDLRHGDASVSDGDHVGERAADVDAEHVVSLVGSGRWPLVRSPVRAGCRSRTEARPRGSASAGRFGTCARPTSHPR